MIITILLTCHKTGPHLNNTLQSIYQAAAQADLQDEIQIRILTPLPEGEFLEVPQPHDVGVNLELFTTMPVGGILSKFDEYLATTETIDPQAVFVFSNDDVVYGPDFLAHIAETDLVGKIAGPVIYTPAGGWQTSMFRKRFTFLRLMFRVHDGGFYSRFFPAPSTLAGINYGRKTVDGCCFIMTEATLRRFNRRFNFVAFLYMEEALFQYLHDRHGIRSEVNQMLQVTHLGGATAAHVWSPKKSLIQLDSVSAVSRTYLGHAPWQTRLLRAWFQFESCARTVLGKILT